MPRLRYLIIYGALLVLTGLLIALFSSNPSRMIQYIVTAGLGASAFFAFMTAHRSKHMEAPLNYHALQGIGLAAFAIAVLVHASTLARFLDVVTYFLLFFGITELIFAFQMLTRPKIDPQIIIIRAIVGFITAGGGLWILFTTAIDHGSALLGAAILFVLVGAEFIMFAMLFRRSKTHRAMTTPG